MNARLIAVDPQSVTEPPAMPSLLLQVEEDIVLYNQGWTQEIARSSLESLTEDAVRAALPIRVDERVYLSSVRELPSDDLMSPEMLQWIRQWWTDFVATLTPRKPIAKAS